MISPSPNARFEAVWSRNCVNDTTSGPAIGLALLNLYAESKRHYHTFDHIQFCLGLFDEVQDQCDNADAVELAIWFHDAVYNFPVEDNEKLSAEYFLNVTEGCLSEEMRQIVYHQVIATDHRTRPHDKDQQILVDIDLSSFGRPWDQFLKDGENVRLELAYLDNEEFYRRQIGFMKQLVNREHFYNTSWFINHFETTARNNLCRYLESLGREGYAVS